MFNLWAAEWHSKNIMDGETRHLIIYDRDRETFALFRTRRECLEFIKSRYGYIANRPDLQEEPHGWMVPHPVKVRIIKAEHRH